MTDIQSKITVTQQQHIALNDDIQSYSVSFHEWEFIKRKVNSLSLPPSFWESEFYSSVRAISLGVFCSALVTFFTTPQGKSDSFYLCFFMFFIFLFTHKVMNDMKDRIKLKTNPIIDHMELIEKRFIISNGNTQTEGNSSNDIYSASDYTVIENEIETQNIDVYNLKNWNHEGNPGAIVTDEKDKCLKVTNMPNTNSALILDLGVFKKGCTYRASALFKCDSSVEAGIFLGDADGDYNNFKNQFLLGLNKWQEITVQVTYSCDDKTFLYLYASRNMDKKGDFVLYRNIKVEKIEI